MLDHIHPYRREAVEDLTIEVEKGNVTVEAGEEKVM